MSSFYNTAHVPTVHQTEINLHWYTHNFRDWNVSNALPISIKCNISYGNQLLDLNCKANDWFLYEMQDWTEIG